MVVVSPPVALTPARLPNDWRRRASWLVALLWSVAAVGASLAPLHRHENNFEIFRSAFWHLVARQDLYAASTRYFDLFKYTPTFAVLVAPFALLPFGVGLVAWNLTNAAALYWAIGRLVPAPKATIVRLVAFTEMVGSLQSAQCNALIAALIIITCVELARAHSSRAAWAVMVGAFVKVFPLAACSFAWVSPRPWRFARWCVALGLLLFLLPMVIAGPAWFAHQYSDWLRVQYIDAGDPGFSVMQLVHLIFGVQWPAWPQQLLGAGILVAPLLARGPRRADEEWSPRYVASLLMFCVLFNHQSESPSFVIALTGVGLWFAYARRTTWHWALLALVFVGTVLVSSSVMPSRLRAELFDLHVKTIPVLLVWIILQVDLWRGPRFATAPAETAGLFGTYRDGSRPLDISFTQPREAADRTDTP